MPTKRRTISFVLYPEFQLLDAAGPIAAFEVAARFVPGAYTLRLTASAAGAVRSSSGISLEAERIGRLAGVDTVVAVGGFGCRKALEDTLLMRFLRKADTAVARMASVCSGAMLLAEAGLLDGRRVTTHWGRVQEMRQRYPSVRVESDRLWIRDGRYWTSAGISAGIDLTLALVTEDLGPDVARGVASQLVVAAQRPGGQTQHSRLLDLTPPDSRFAELNAWISQRLDEPLSVEDLAAHVKMSPRTFSRAYTAETGVSPARAVERLRVEAARALIEGGARPEGGGGAHRVSASGDDAAGLRANLRAAAGGVAPAHGGPRHGVSAPASSAPLPAPRRRYQLRERCELAVWQDAVLEQC